MSAKKIAVVTGANRGIGLEICRQLAEQGMRVVLTARDRAKGQQAADQLQSQDLDVTFRELDVADSESISEFRQFVESEFGRLDILINNAGILLDGEISGLDVPAETVCKTFETNTIGPLQLSQQIIPLMQKNDYGRIVMLSSRLGALSDMAGGYPGYRISKAALNAVTAILAAELSGSNILVNTMSPGWVRTEMGGLNATRSVAEGAETAIWLATLPDGGPSGKFFADKQEIAW